MAKEIKPVEPRETKKVETKKIEVLKFKNTQKSMKIKLVEKDKRRFKWITVKTDEIVSVPRDIAKRNGLIEVR